MKLNVSDDLKLPIEAVTEKFAFLGRTGSGKSYAAQKMAEEMARAKAQFVVLDPVGVWYGLRLSAGGKTPGIDIPVLGGRGGDIPLEPSGGALIAYLVVDRCASMVLDVSQFESDAAKARFAHDFADRFFFRKKAAPSAVHIFIDEAQEFCLTEDTEILTNKGWKKHTEIKVGDLASCFNLQTEGFEFQPIQRLLVRDHDGPMVHLKTKALDCMMTNDHRAVIGRVQRAPGR